MHSLPVSSSFAVGLVLVSMAGEETGLSMELSDCKRQG